MTIRSHRLLVSPLAALLAVSASGCIVAFDGTRGSGHVVS